MWKAAAIMWRLFLYLCIMTIDQLIKNLNKIDVNSIVDESIIENESNILDLNREQLDIGLLSDGSILPDYSETSVTVFGKRAGAIRLFDTGNFWEGFYIDMGEKAFDVRSKDSKEAMLLDRYTTDIFGLVPKQKTEAAKIVKSYFISNLKKQLGI